MRFNVEIENIRHIIATYEKKVKAYVKKNSDDTAVLYQNEDYCDCKRIYDKYSKLLQSYDFAKKQRVSL